MKEKKIITEDFFIGNLGDTKVTDEIKNSYLKTIGNSLEELVDTDGEGIIGHESLVEHTIRKCYISWMHVNDSNFIEQGLRSIIENTNRMIWKKSLLHEWQAMIQFTKYIGNGDHYSWHTDTGLQKSSLLERKLSIVYCLSKKSDYTGGEFQIKTSNNGIYSKKFDYGDFIVFPSDIMHRVKPLKSGTRITMVGWYR